MTEPRDPFEIEAPPPGEIFYRLNDIVHPENLELMEGDERARELDRKQKRTLERQKGAILAILEKFGYQRRSERISRLDGQIEDLQTRLHRLEGSPSYTPQRASRLQLAISRRQQAVARLQRKQEKLRPAAARLHRIELRLAEHEAAIRNKKLYKRLFDEQLREVEYFGRLLIECWARLKQKDDFYEDGKRKIKKVQIEEAHVTPDQIFYKIKVASTGLFYQVQNHLPDGVRVKKLVEPDTLAELSAACERPVGSPHVPPENFGFHNGAWVWVDRLGMNDGIYNYIRLTDIMARYNTALRDLFPLAVGARRGRVIVWIQLAKTPHLIVSGVPGSGKSNLTRAWICTLIQMHSPDELRLVFVDLKRGGDYEVFGDIPHLLGGRIIKEFDDVAELMPALVKLMYSRLETIAKIKAVDILEYNIRVLPSQRLPRIVVVIDEYSAINYTGHGKAASELNRSAVLIASQARAAGIHLVIGTQQPSAEGVPKGIKDNATFAVSGRQRTLGGSLSTMGTGEVRKLASIPGRMLVDDGTSDPYQVQTPHATEEDIKRALEAAANWPQPRELELDLGGESVEEETHAPPPADDRDAVIISALRERPGIRLDVAKRIPGISQATVYRRLDRLKEAGVVQSDEFGVYKLVNGSGRTL